MKALLSIGVIVLLMACQPESSKRITDRYIVETEVQLKQGQTEKVLALFKSTNPELVAGEKDWLCATFSTIEGEDIVIVRAEWRSKESYLKFSSSKKFKETMSQFGEYFISKPNVTISKVLFEM